MLKYANKIIIVVDGYSTGALFVNALLAKGIACVHIQSFSCQVSFLSETHNQHSYLLDLKYNDNYQSLLNRLTAFSSPQNYLSVLVGTTDYNGFLLADTLAEDLGIPSNSSSSTMDRVDKYLTGEAMKRHGLTSLHQICTDSYDELKAFVEMVGYPVVIKPRLSGGSVGVKLITNESLLNQAFNEEKKPSLNLFGTEEPQSLRGKILAQDYACGEEYLVCAFSVNGEHYITSLWHNKKRVLNHSSSIARDCMILKDHTASDVSHILNYIKQSLTALGIDNGPSNSDVVVNGHDEIKLLEVNPRIPGSMEPMAFIEGLGESFIDQTVKYSLNSDLVEHDSMRTRSLNKYVYGVSVINSRADSRECGLPHYNLEAISNLQSFISCNLKKPGTMIGETTDITNIIGMIWLAHESETLLLEDVQKIRSWEHANF